MSKFSTQKAMFSEMQDKELFNKAQEYGFQYIDKAFDRNVHPSKQALSDLSHFVEDFPEESTDGETVIDLLHKFGSPATSTSIAGRYFGFVIGSAIPAGLAAKNLATFWDQNTAMQVISPICSKLEVVVQNWLNQIFNLPKETVAGFVSGTSTATFCGLAAARYRLLQRKGWDLNEKGLFDAPKIRVVTGRHVHSSALKVIGLLGIGKNNIEWVEVDDQGRMIVESMPELDNNTLLILQAGNVDSGSFDPIHEIMEKANKANSWVHIDGAFGLWAHVTEELRHLTKGIEKANSWAVDGHKTLNTPYDCGIILCKDEDAMVSSLHMAGGYIIRGDEKDGMYYTPEMSRRGRIVELWATMKYLGLNGIKEIILNLHERAMQFGNEVSQIDGYKVVNEIVFNQILVTCESDEITDNTVKKIQELRECWVGGSSWQGRRVIRISVCSWATTEEDISRSVRSFRKAIEDK